MTNKTAVITIQIDQIDWMKKHPERFINSLISRINSGETDKHPGYSRWDGDGIPGVQLVCITEENKIDLTNVIAVGNGFGVRLGSLNIRNDNSQSTKFKIIKKLLEKFGFKNINNSNKTTRIVDNDRTKE